MDFEPWLRDQLAPGDGRVSPATSPEVARRPRTRFRLPGFRLGLAVGAIGMVAIGLASGRALPVLQLTSPAPRAQELPVATWGGVPSEPPGGARLASDQGSAGPGSGPGPSGSTPAAGSAGDGSSGTSSPGGHTEDGGHPAGNGSALPTPRPVDDHGGSPASGSPTPQPTAAAPDDHGGRSPDPTSTDSRRGRQPDPLSSPTPGH